MCIIIDANQASKLGNLVDNPHFAEIIKWVVDGGKVVSGGYLHTELVKIGPIRALLLEWDRAGRLKKISSDLLTEIEKGLDGKCLSDDPHIIALTISSKAGLIVTGDKNLIRDLKDRNKVAHRPKIFPEIHPPNRKKTFYRRLLRAAGCM